MKTVTLARTASELAFVVLLSDPFVLPQRNAGAKKKCVNIFTQDYTCG
jgi:hypothetical protein